MNILKLILIVILCLPSFAGIKATRSATNPATYIDADGVIQLLTLSNTVRPKNYYDLTGFHALSGWMKEGESTNYVLNSFCSVDTNSDGLAEGFAKIYGTATLETCSINNIAGGKSQKIAYTFLGTESNYSSLLNISSENDSFNASAGNVNVVVSFWYRGSMSGMNISTFDTKWISIDEVNNAGTTQRNLYSSSLNGFTATWNGSATVWKKFSKAVTLTDRDTRKIKVFFVQLGASNKPAANENCWLEVYGLQAEIGTTETSLIPTTTAVLTRNAESYKCRKYLD
jgi:hypothetical protein